jgi:hypothetical protein
MRTAKRDGMRPHRIFDGRAGENGLSCTMFCEFIVLIAKAMLRASSYKQMAMRYQCLSGMCTVVAVLFGLEM